MDFDIVEESLKNIIDDEGIDYLSREPYEVYQYLTDDMELDGRLCRAVLSVLLAGVVEEALHIQGVQIDAEGKPDLTGISGVIEDSNQIPDHDLEKLSRWVQKECFYKKVWQRIWRRCFYLCSLSRIWPHGRIVRGQASEKSVNRNGSINSTESMPGIMTVALWIAG